VDSWAFQGNSGSPVVIPPSLIRACREVVAE
jgi:hypothetical protein